MNYKPNVAGKLVACLIATAITWACSSSGGGISGTSLVFGPIADFGSVIVGGITFDAGKAVITIEGDAADEADLRLGMVVFVRGKVNANKMTGKAERIATNHLLLAPVEGVNAADGTFAALSQLIITDAGTVFAGVTIETLVAGDKVEVFGVRDADLSIHATRVERFDDIEEIELTGPISNLDENAMTFDIALLTVDYSGAVIEDEIGDGFSNGLIVEVETDQAPLNDLMIAKGVEVPNPDVLADPGDALDIEGFITETISAEEFVLNGVQQVLTTPETRFEGGTAADLVVNARVDVEGPLDETGMLIADEVEFLP